MPYDLFISHASEDKHTVAVPLADYLPERGLSVWLDIDELTLGDSLRSAIDRGLRDAKFGVVILSPAFVAKVWPRRELGALFALEQGVDSKVILPVRHNIDTDELLEFSPMLADRLSVSTSEGIAAVGDAVMRAVRPSADSQPPQGSGARRRREDRVSGFQRRILSAAGEEDIRRIIVELETHLERYPQDVDARLLLDKARRAFELELRRRVSKYAYKMSEPVAGPLAYLSAILALLGLLFGLYILIRWLRSLF